MSLYKLAIHFAWTILVTSLCISQVFSTEKSAVQGAEHAPSVGQSTSSLSAADSETTRWSTALTKAIESLELKNSEPTTSSHTEAEEVSMLPAPSAVERKPTDGSKPIKPVQVKKAAKPKRYTQKSTVVKPKNLSKPAPALKTKRNINQVKKRSRFDRARDRVIETARGLTGLRYVWGGTTPAGFDCSGFTRYVYRLMGNKLPRVARHQYQKGHPIKRSDLRPGDLVFFKIEKNYISHVGIYLGKDKFVHAANPRKGVRIDNLSSSYYSKYYVGARCYAES